MRPAPGRSSARQCRCGPRSGSRWRPCSPCPTSPSTFSFGTLQSSRISSLVEEARMPSLSSFLPTVNPGKLFFDEEGGDALVSSGRIERGEQNEQTGFFAVGDPELAAVQNIFVTLERGAGLESESVGAGAGLTEGVCADRARRPFSADSASSDLRWSSASGRC